VPHGFLTFCQIITKLLERTYIEYCFAHDSAAAKRVLASAILSVPVCPSWCHVLVHQAQMTWIFRVFTVW